jgi:hypothetical protein
MSQGKFLMTEAVPEKYQHRRVRGRKVVHKGAHVLSQSWLHHKPVAA